MLSARAQAALQAYLLPTFVAFAILWRGGKSLDATWLLVAVAWLLISVVYKRPASALPEPKQGTASALGFFFVFWTFVSFVFSKTANYGFDELLRDGSLVLLFLWSVSVFAAEEGVALKQRILNVLRVSTLLACAVGAWVYVTQPVDRFVGTFFDWRFHTDFWPNAWAEYLLLAWPIFLLPALQLELRTRRQLVWFVISLGAVVGCLLLSYSRGALLAFGGQAALLAGYLFLNGFSKAEWKRILLLTTAIAVTALVTFAGVNAVRGLAFPVQSVADKVTFTAEEGTSSIDERSAFWNQSLMLAQANPVFGWGPYSFRFLQPHLQTGVLATSDHPHNVFLKLLAERGLPAAAAFAALLLFVLVPAMRRTLSTLAPTPAVLLIALLGTLAHNLLDFNLQFVGIALPFWLFLGMLTGNFFSTQKEHTARLLRLARRVCISLLLLAALVEAPLLLASSVGRRAEREGDVETACKYYALARHQLFSRDLHLSRTRLCGQESIQDYFAQNVQDGRAYVLAGQYCATGEKSEQCVLQNALLAYEANRWNDLQTVSQLIVVLPAQAKALQPEIRALLFHYAVAFETNAHFIALSPQLEEFLVALREYEKAFGYDEELKKRGVAAAAHALQERARLRGREE